MKDHPDTTKIYKYHLVGDDRCHLSAEVPAGAKIVKANIQRGVFVIWCIVQPVDAIMETLYFTVTGTGFDVPPDSVHIESIFDGPFVWHLFQEDLVDIDVD
jgi:hypothetical protein